MLLAVFGISMFALGSVMLLRPLKFAQGVSAFSEKSWFHVFEVASRFILGLIFFGQATFSSFPLLHLLLGATLGFTSIFLVIIGPAKHRQFAKQTSNLGNWFRPIGLFAIVIASLLIYLGHKEYGA